MTRTAVRGRANFKRHHIVHRRRSFPGLAVFTVLLAAAGILLSLFFSVKPAAAQVKKPEAAKSKAQSASYFDKYLEPVVMFDPKPFGEISGADGQWKLKTAIWAALGDSTGAQYTCAPDGREILPEKDAAIYYKKYFGNEKPSFRTFSDSGGTYEYSKKEKCYYIPLIALTGYYVPRVTKIKTGDGIVTLTVQYIPGKNWGQGKDGSLTEPAPDKTMFIVLSQSRGDYSVKSIETDGSGGNYSSSKNSSI